MRYGDDTAKLYDIPSVLDFAHEIINMQNRIADLECENARLREYERLYHEVIERDAKHATEMMGVTLKAILNGMIVAPRASREDDPR